MKIEKIAPSQHVANRYLITLSDESILKADLNLIADLDLYPGKELSEAQLQQLREASQRAMAKAKALKIMGARNMSRKEITQRLVRRGESQQVADETADWLENVGAVDDGAYAGMIVRHYSKMGYGLGRVKNELYKRGIPRELWQEALDELPDMEDSAYETLCRKLGDTADPARIKKASDGLIRRGFSWEEVRTAVSRYQSEHEMEPTEYE